MIGIAVSCRPARTRASIKQPEGPAAEAAEAAARNSALQQQPDSSVFWKHPWLLGQHFLGEEDVGTGREGCGSAECSIKTN